MNLKYAAQLKECTDQPCPSSRFQPRNFIGFRILKSTPDSNDFLPPAIKRGMGSRVDSSNYALSFFDNIPNARTHYHKLKDKGMDVASLFGDSICEIKVESTDGLSCPPSKKGHIDIHEEQNATLLGKIVGHHAP